MRSPSMHAPQFRRGPRAPVTVSKKDPSVNTSTDVLARSDGSGNQNFATFNIVVRSVSPVRSTHSHRADPWHLA